MNEILQKSIACATERSAFYRERFGGNPNAFTTPEDLRLRGLEMLCVPPGEVTRIVTLATSGSSAAPKRVYFTPRDLECTVSFFERGMARMLLPNDRLCCLFPTSTPYGVGDLLTTAVRRIPVEVVERPQDATFIVGSPAQLTQLPTQPLRGVLLSADYVSEAARKDAANRFGAEVWEHYGLTESGYGFAVSCGADLDFYHVRTDDLFVEIIDPNTSEPLPDGQLGEIVFTTLTREAMPMVRYRSGDLSRLTRGECSHCGRETVTLSRVGDRGLRKGI